MIYYMINTHEGNPVAVVELREGTAASFPFDWVDPFHCLNKIEDIAILGANIHFRDSKGNSFAVMQCASHEEAKTEALNHFGHMVCFSACEP
jgi:hypothetical protein